jgi:nicotinate-nucleotide adenylyltransferase
MRIGYFGGSFDPPHLGHLAVARAAAAAFHLDEVLFVPTAHQPLKPAGTAAPYADRLAMTTLLCAADPTFAAADLEAPTPTRTPNYTIDTLTRLQHLHPAAHIFVLIGADAFLTLPQWRAPTQLLHLADWIVISRPGSTFPANLAEGLPALTLTPAQLNRIHPLTGIAEPASATEARALLRNLPTTGPIPPDLEAQLQTLLPPAILTYIRTHHLYR